MVKSGEIMAVKKIIQESANGFANINLKYIPFEPQGEFDPTISVEDSLLRQTELKQGDEIIDMARRGGKLIAAVVKGEPSAGKTHLAYKLIDRSRKYHPSTEHIYIRMESGTYDDPFFILALIVNRLEIACNTLDQEKVSTCLKNALELSFKELKLEKSNKDELRRATYLMSTWYGYIDALTTIGRHDCVVIHIDEVEDRWGMASMTTSQIERDLKYLRDLLGYIQEGKQDQKFPVALFLYMTDITYQRIHSINNALETRLKRIIPLSSFSEQDALDYVKIRLEKSRIKTTGIDDFNPFTRESIHLIIKISKDSNDHFSFRQFIINCHDILFYVNRRGGGDIDKAKVNEWQLESGSHRVDTKKHEQKGKESEIDLVELKDTRPAREKYKEYASKGLLTNTELQLDLAVEKMSKILPYCSDRFSIDNKTKKIACSIPGEKAKIPLTVKKGSDPKTSTDIFCVYVLNKENKSKKVGENEAILVLPSSPEMMIRYSLFDENLLSVGELNKGREEITPQITSIIEKINAFYKKNREQHYIPHLLGAKLQNDEDYEIFIKNLESLSKCETQKINTDILMECGFFDGAGFAIPYWYNQIVSRGIFNPDHLWKEVFYLNSENRPIEAAVTLLKKLQITDGLKIRVFEDRRTLLNNSIVAYSKEMTSAIEASREAAGDTLIEKFDSKISAFDNQLSQIKNEITAFKPTDNIFTNFINLYAYEVRVKDVVARSNKFISFIREISQTYNTRKTALTSAIQDLKKLKFKDSQLEKELVKFDKELEQSLDRSDLEKYILASKPVFEELMAKYNAFSSKGKNLERDLKDFNIAELITASKKKVLDLDEKKLKEDWEIIKKSDNINIVETKLSTLHGTYADLGQRASAHIKSLSEKYGEANLLLRRYEQFLNKSHFQKIKIIVDDMDKRIANCRTLINNGKMYEALEVTLDDDFKRLGPTFKSLFKPNKVYTIGSIGEEFGLDDKKAREFVRFLEESDVLCATYKVS